MTISTFLTLDGQEPQFPFVEIWNLQSGERLGAFRVSTELPRRNSLICGRHFIFRDLNFAWIEVRTASGDVVVRYEERNTSITGFTAISQSEVLLALYDGIVVSVKHLDVGNGLVSDRFTCDDMSEAEAFVNAENPGPFFVYQLLVCRRKWVALLFMRTVPGSEEWETSGIYIYDLDTNRKVHFLPGRDRAWCHMKQASDCQSTICVGNLSRSIFHVLHLDPDSGHLSTCCSFPGGKNKTILGVFGKRVYVFIDGGKCKAYNTETGEQEQIWDYIPVGVSQKRNELLCVDWKFESITAYCLDDARSSEIQNLLESTTSRP